MQFKIMKRFLTRKNEAEYKAVFRSCFTALWRSSIPFPNDPIYTAIDEDGKVIGFGMTHHEAPQKMKQGAGGYMYNLCVDPSKRRHGVGSAILNAIIEDYPQCYTHMDIDSDDVNHAFMSKLGWVRIGTLHKYYEYALIPNVVIQEAPPVKYNPHHYDAEQNVIYID